jgi:hypothetical protein
MTLLRMDVNGGEAAVLFLALQKPQESAPMNSAIRFAKRGRVTAELCGLFTNCCILNFP